MELKIDENIELKKEVFIVFDKVYNGISERFEKQVQAVFDRIDRAKTYCKENDIEFTYNCERWVIE